MEPIEMTLAREAGQQAADALETAFAKAGERIEQSLARAARSGERDFERMAESILRDLARVAAEALILSNGRGTPPAPALNFHLGTQVPPDTPAGRSSLAAALSRLVSTGSRYL